MAKRAPVASLGFGWLILAALCIMASVASSRAAPFPGRQAPQQPQYRQDRVLVSFRNGVPQAERAATLSALGVQADSKFSNPYFARVTIPSQLRAAGMNVKGLIAQLKRNKNVAVAEPDYLYHALAVPNDPRFPETWGLNNTGQTILGFPGTPDADIDAPEAWNITTGSVNVVVAVIDTGVDYTHTDLTGNILRDSLGEVVGFDAVDHDGDPMDEHGHGSHCAGTIGAKSNNGIGVAGVCWNVRIMPVRFLDASGFGSTSGAIEAVDFARTHGAHIMSNSWGGGGYSELLLAAIQRARDAGILFVAAAGNDAGNNDGFPSYPASYNRQSDNVLSVAASDNTDKLASFSNYGSQTVDLAAPGVNVLSTTYGDYEYFSGTSMATPHVSGVAALVKAKYPTFTATQIKARILANVDHPVSLAGLVRTGRLNAAGALTVDTVAPGAPTLLKAVSRASGALTLNWKSSGDDGAVGAASEYDLRYSMDPITAANFNQAPRALGMPDPAISGTAQSYVLNDLEPATTYYLALRTYDNGGNLSPITVPGAFGYVTLAKVYALNDPAEATPKFAGVVVSGSVASTWAASTEQKYGGAKSYSDSPGTYYKINSDTALQQSTATALAGQGWSLIFRAKLLLEPGYDFLYPEITKDGGATWDRLGALTGHFNWGLYSIPLTDYAGTTVKVRFRLVSDFAGPDNGVWLDDIQLARTPGYIAPLDETVEGPLLFAGESPWAATTERSYSPTHSYTDSPGGSYGYNVSASLAQSASILIDQGSPLLTFRARTDMEPYYDYVLIETSTDNGAHWAWTGYYLTGVQGWNQYAIPLGAYTGKNLQIRFHLLTDDSGSGDGVWLDNIRISGEPLQLLAAVPPNPPNTLTAALAETSKVNLSWKDGSTTETTWQIQRKAGAGTFLPLVNIASTTGAATGGVISYTAAGLAANTQYTFRVRAANAAGASYFLQSPLLTTLGAPTALTAAPISNSQINLSWKDGSITETQWRIWRSADNVTFAEVAAIASATGAATGGTVNYSATGLAANTTYYFKVQASSGVGVHRSTLSTAANAKTLP